MRRNSTVLIGALLVVGMAACDDDDDLTGPDEEFSATLAPAGDIQSSGSGSASFELDDGEVSYTLDVAGLTGVTAAHIHGPASATQDAGVIVLLFGGPQTGAVNGRLAAGSFTEADITAANVSMDSLLVLMRNGQSYVNVHTTAHPGGEIRGQIRER